MGYHRGNSSPQAAAQRLEHEPDVPAAPVRRSRAPGARRPDLRPMSRRSRYGRAQHAAARPPRLESTRPEASRPRPTTPGPAPATAPATAAPAGSPTTAPAAAEALPRNGHFSPDLPAGVVPGAIPASQPSNGHIPLVVPAAPTQVAPSNGHVAPESPGCTAPQLRRFIKSRTYVPMHELRRRFGINGTEDDVTPLDTDGRRIFVGLPSREGRLLGELFRPGDVGYELSFDPLTPVVVGVYPMRPVPRS